MSQIVYTSVLWQGRQVNVKTILPQNIALRISSDDLHQEQAFLHTCDHF